MAYSRCVWVLGVIDYLFMSNVNYNRISGVQHFTFNHSLVYVNKETGLNTNHIELTWKCIKMLISRNRVIGKINEYLLELEWKRPYKNICIKHF